MHSRTLAPLALLLALACTAAPAQDRCLVGSWQPQGNAIAEWMQRRNPAMAMQFRQDSAHLVFHADGRYSADMRGEASAQARAGIGARMGGQFGGSGRWSTRGETLELRQGEDRSQAELALKQRGAVLSKTRVATGAVTPQQFGYRCEGDHFETRMTLPGGSDVVIQPYRRQRS